MQGSDLKGLILISSFFFLYSIVSGGALLLGHGMAFVQGFCTNATRAFVDCAEHSQGSGKCIFALFPYWNCEAEPQARAT